MGARRLQDATPRAGRISTVYYSTTDYTKCFDVLTMSLNGTRREKEMAKFVSTRANLSLIVGLYDACYSCEIFLQKMNMPAFRQVRDGAASLLLGIYQTYGADEKKINPSPKVLPVMPHCDNDFETMALKHSLGLDSEGQVTYAPPSSPSVADRRLEEEEATACKCPFMLMGKDLFRPGEGVETYAAAWQADNL